MPTHYYRTNGPDGRFGYVKVELPAGQKLELPAGGVEITEHDYTTGLAATEKATANLLAGSDAALQHITGDLDAARKAVVDRLHELGIPGWALNTLMPGLALPDGHDLGDGEI